MIFELMKFIGVAALMLIGAEYHFFSFKFYPYYVVIVLLIYLWSLIKRYPWYNLMAFALLIFGVMYSLWATLFPYSIWGLLCINIGTSSNLIVMMANKGFMPATVSPEICTEGSNWNYIPMDSQTRLKFLGDFINIGGKSSPGDLLIVGGIYITIAEILVDRGWKYYVFLIYDLF